MKHFVIGNEPNQPRFWQPQFGPDGSRVAAATFFEALWRAYDALKAVDPAIRVIGIGLSERGNDNPSAPSNASTSPVRFLRDLGAAYRASGRTAPLMDELDFHPYPESPRDPLTRAYAWPSVGFGNVDRLKQAIWDAFAGTGQPTVEDGLRLRIGETGWQVGVVPSAAASYHGSRERARHGRGRAGRDLRTARAARGVRPGDRGRPSSSASSTSPTSTASRPRSSGRTARAGPRSTPCGRRSPRRAGAAPARRSRGGMRRRSSAGPPASATSGRASGSGRRGASASPPAEEATFRAGIHRLPANPKRHAAALRALQATPAPAALPAAGTVRAHWTPRVVFPSRRLGRGTYVYRVELAATMNPARTSVFVSRPFVVR